MANAKQKESRGKTLVSFCMGAEDRSRKVKLYKVFIPANNYSGGQLLYPRLEMLKRKTSYV